MTLARDLEAAIRSGAFGPGQRIPGELELAAAHGISRTTARLAIQRLEANNLVHRRAGSGTFVAPNAGGSWPVRSSFANFVKTHAGRLRRAILCAGEQALPPDVADALGTRRGALGLFFRRLDTLDGTPMAYDDGWIAHKYAQTFQCPEDFLDFDFFAVWKRRQLPPITRTSLELRAEGARPEAARFLGLAAGAPLLVERCDMFTTDSGAARCTTFYRHDMYTFRRDFLHETDDSP